MPHLFKERSVNFDLPMVTQVTVECLSSSWFMRRRSPSISARSQLFVGGWGWTTARTNQHLHIDALHASARWCNVFLRSVIKDTSPFGKKVYSAKTVPRTLYE